MKKIAPLLAPLLGAAVLVGCGSSGSGDAGDADVAFAQQMIPHHVQAVEMSDLALERSQDDDVRSLAAEIRGAQDPEVDVMTGWLRDWGEEVPETDGGGMAGHEGHEGMAGMMTADDMDALARASGEAFDRLWLEQMVRHHEGAVEMAEQQQADGTYEPAVELAEEIAASQREEIARMQALLDR